MSDFRIDSHKLSYHIDRIYDWSKGEDIYPIYMEISPTTSCNHRCIFCAFDYLEYPSVFIDKKVLKRFLSQIAKRGVKGIMFAGEGEPLLHKDIAEFIIYTKEKGIDVAITTSGVLLKKDLISPILERLSWLRLSIDAGSSKTYSLIHRCPEKDFDKVIANLQEAVRIRKDKGYSTTIGVQFLLLNQNYCEAVKLARCLKKMGVDYLIIKPYSKHKFSINRLDRNLNYNKFLSLENELKTCCRDNFRVIFRKHTMLKVIQRRPYTRCYGLSFWSYLSSGGDLYACSSFLGDKRFCYGNIYKKSFDKIWRGPERRRILKMMESNWDINNCRINCRMDEVNRYLWDLKFPPPHVNFI